MTNRTNDLYIENARIIFKNFTGKEKKNNPEGDRNFCVLIEDDNVAESLAREGWNVKPLQPRNDSDPELHFIQVRVSYRVAPPSIYTLSGKFEDEEGNIDYHKKVRLAERNVNKLDRADIESVDLKISPYHWEMNGKTGIKAYLKSMVVVLREDELSRKYNLDDIDDDEEEDDEAPFA